MKETWHIVFPVLGGTKGQHLRFKSFTLVQMVLYWKELLTYKETFQGTQIVLVKIGVLL
jgi:hypothetical protein